MPDDVTPAPVAAEAPAVPAEEPAAKPRRRRRTKAEIDAMVGVIDAIG